MSIEGAAAPLRLGRQMAHRGRSQAVLAQRWSRVGMVGAVGRASVGFGIAVGRARSIRPTVLFDDVNSAALRPSFDLWRTRRDSADAVAFEAADTDAAASVGELGDASAAAVRRTAAATRPVVPTGASRTVASGSSGNSANSAARRRRATQQAQRSRPTWTDQVIARSAIGYTAPRSTATRVEPERPADFVPTGDEKLDRLRLLVQQKQNDPVRRPSAGSARSTADDAASTTSARSGATSHDVSAIDARPRHVGAVPGVLARSMRPESAMVAPAPGSSPRLGGATPTPGSSPRLGNATPTPGASAGPRRSRQVEPTKQERLKQLLIERGLVADDSVPDGAGADRPGGGATADDSPRTTTTGAPLRRSGTSDNNVRRSPSPIDRPGPQRRPTNSTSSGADTRRDPGAVRPGGSSDQRAAAPGRVDAPRATAPAGRPPDTRPASGSHDSADSAFGAQAGVDPASRSSVAVADRTVAQSATSSQMRLRRLLRSDRLERDGFSPGDDPDLSPGDDPVLSPALDRSGFVDAGDGDRGAAAVTRPTASATGVGDPTSERPAIAALAATVAPPAPGLRVWAARMPALPGDLIARRPGEVTLRRLTLPRATSTTHRPVSVLPTPGRPAATTTSPIVAVDGVAAPNGAARVTVGGGDRAPLGRVDPTGMDSPGSARVTQVVSADERTEVASSRPGPIAPTSTMSASDAAALHRVGTAATVRRSAATVPTAPARWADAVRSTRSVVTPGPGALAGVVRRSAAAPDLVVGRSFGSLETSHLAPSRSLAVHAASAPGTIGRVTATTSSRPLSPTGAAAPAATVDADGRSGGTGAVGEGVRDGVGVASTPAEAVAARFMTSLSATVRRRPAPLPTPFRPMADAIAGPRPVMLSTDAASRRALRSVGKMAATTGDTIHLDPTAVPRARLDEVVAHELTHIAHPSPAPRFFDDIDDSPEERRAEQIARVMARSPLAPSSSVVAPRSGAANGTPIRRSAVTLGGHRAAAAAATRPGGGSPSDSSPSGAWSAGSSSSSSSSTVSAAALAARLTSGTTAPQDSSSVIHRKMSSSPPPAPPAPAVESSPSTPSGRAPQESSGGPSSPFGSEQEAGQWFDKRLAANVGPLLRMMEDRMRIELERRGGRNWRRS
jgi:hypothetical protein